MGFNSAFKGLVICTAHPISCGWWNREEWDMRACSTYGGGERRV